MRNEARSQALLTWSLLTTLLALHLEGELQIVATVMAVFMGVIAVIIGWPRR